MDRTTDERLKIAESVVGHVFADKELLSRALTHPSVDTGQSAPVSYERLEFLGDSVLGLVVAEEAFRRFHDLDEGGLSRIKTVVVSGRTLSGVAADLGLERAILMGESEAGTGKRGLASALENVFEALVAAVYIDAGFDVARRWILESLGDRISAEHASAPENPKSLLQEITQVRGVTPEYRTLSTDGPPHDRTFEVAVYLSGEEVGRGSGRSKKDAEAAAARSALEAREEIG